jgi:VWFA-related protein
VKNTTRRTHAYWIRVALTLAVLGATTFRAAGQQSQAPTTRETRDRHVFITVVDKDDKVVTDLTPADVVVREDGATREIARVSKATAPLQIALLVDDSASTMNMTQELRKAFSGFVSTVAETNPDSEFSLTTFGERPTVVVQPTTSVSVVTRAIDKIMPRTGTGSYLLQAIVETSKAIKKRNATKETVAARPHIVAFIAEDGPEFSNESRQVVTSALKDAGVSLWTVILQGDSVSSTASNERRERAAVITDVAQESGGNFKSILDRQAVTHGLSYVLTQLTSQIDVMYARPDRLIPPTKLEVTVKRPGLKVIGSHWAGQR